MLHLLSGIALILGAPFSLPISLLFERTGDCITHRRTIDSNIFYLDDPVIAAFCNAEIALDASEARILVCQSGKEFCRWSW
jgi:hypothetical protein